MAIQIEQEKQPVNWMGVATALVVIGFALWLIYFFFFSRPEILADFIPHELEEIEQINREAARLDPESFAESPQFIELQDYGFSISTPSVGRNNPFMPQQ